LLRPPPRPSTLFPYTTLFRSAQHQAPSRRPARIRVVRQRPGKRDVLLANSRRRGCRSAEVGDGAAVGVAAVGEDGGQSGGRRSRDRKSTRLNSSHVKISYAVF